MGALLATAIFASKGILEVWNIRQQPMGSDPHWFFCY